MSTFNHRAAIIISAARRANARTAWVADFPEGQAEAGTFAVALSLSGSAPAQAFGAETALNAALRNKLQNRAADANLTGIRIYVWRASDNELVWTNSGTATLGQPWSFAASLSDLGLKRIVPAGP